MKFSLEFEVPEGWLVAPGDQPRPVIAGEYVLDAYGGASVACRDIRDMCIVLIKDPLCVPVEDEEYKVKVYRAWLRGAKIEQQAWGGSFWIKSSSTNWRWEHFNYRVVE